MELAAGTTRLVVDEAAGGRLASLLVPRPVGGAGGDGGGGDGGGGDGGGGDGGGDLQLVGRYQPTPHGWGAFPMAPWAGRVRDGLLTWRGATHQLPVTKPPHAIHGLVATVAWDVVEQGPSSAVLHRDVGGDWPWPAHAVLRHELSPGALSTTLEVHADAVPMPAWCGIHPWSPRRLGGVDVEIDLPAQGYLPQDGDGMPTATPAPVPAGVPVATPVDDTFTGVRWPVVLTWPGVARLSVTADAPWAVVFTQREEAVCVEPQTAPPNAAELGLAQVVEPGSPLVLHVTWRWEVLG